MSIPDFSQLKKNGKKDFSGLEPVRVALLGDTATQFLVQAIRGTGFERGFDLRIWEADFDQIERQIVDSGSDLYAFDPAIIIIFQSSHKLLGRYDKLTSAEYHLLADDRLGLIDGLCTAIDAHSGAKIIYYNYTEIDDAVYGNFANKAVSSFIFQLRKLNYGLMTYAAQRSGLYVCDISSIQNQFGKAAVFQPSIYINSDMLLSIDILPAIASRTVDLIGVLCGRLKKCLILDLDNTIWGGVIGDDGLANIQLGSLGIGKAFVEFQRWIKRLKNRGIILAVCSKNTASVAKEPFERHPEMVLRLEDITVFQVNWDSKVENIRQIRDTLHIGFDSMVFLDDNPFERNMVSALLPEVTVPELPEDPADYLEYLYGLNLFETAAFSTEDLERTGRYHAEARRHDQQQKFKDEDSFLESLNMVSRVESFNEFNIPRVAQLSLRSNQFNLRTVRYSEADIKKIAGSPNNFTFSFTLEDSFGDTGIIGVVILEKEGADTLFIDTWLMSCRVLKRGMENFILNTITGFAKATGFGYLKGEYRPTAKNALVKDHYRDLGFLEKGAGWVLDIRAYESKKTHVKNKMNG